MSTLSPRINDLKILLNEEIQKGVSYEGKPSISYSQYSMYANCPKSWELGYARKLKKYRPSIHTVFGTSFHETFQNFLTILYDHSVKAAEDLDLNAYLKERLIFNYNKEVTALKGEHFSTPAELMQFWKDGCDILEWLKKRRRAYFSTKDQILLGIEVPLHVIASPHINPNVYIVSFLDLVLYDKVFNRIKILDIKTSTKGWTDKEKTDPVKKAQVMLYKHYFSTRFDIPLENIEVEFFIVKRQLYENPVFPQKRVQSFIPTQGKLSINKVNKEIDNFISKAFNADGSHNLNTEYYAISGDKDKNCKFCDFKDNAELCPANKRLKALPS